LQLFSRRCISDRDIFFDISLVFLLRLGTPLDFVVAQERETILSRWQNKNMENLIELSNKTPMWNEGNV